MMDRLHTPWTMVQGQALMMRVGTLAAETGASTDTIRLYEARGLIRSDRRSNGYRAFDPSAIGLIRTIRLAQRLGFTLREVGDVLGTLQEAGLPAERIRTLLTSKLDDVDGRIADLHALRSLLQTRLDDVCGLGL